MVAATSPVLLVDDDSGVRRTLRRFLDRDGITCVEAENGQSALTYLQGGGAASVIVLDLRMPIMDGFKFREAQRRDSSLAGIPVIVLSHGFQFAGAARGRRFRRAADAPALPRARRHRMRRGR